MDSVCDNNKRRPCITMPGKPAASTTCASYREPTDAEIEESERAVQALMQRFRDRSARGECTDCGAKIAEVRQVGRCVYAEPCGHRVGQGDADRVRKALGL